MKNDLVYLQHILQAIAYIEAFTKEGERDDKTLAAVVRQIEIIGEASNRLPKEFLKQHAHIPWREMIGMRNILIHMYEEVSDEDIWETVSVHIPQLKYDIMELVKAYDVGES